MPAVLLVDDDPSTLELLDHILRFKGYRLLEAATGSEALEVSATYQGPIPLLITDIAMPDVNGLEVARRITAERTETRVLFITAYRKLFDVSAAVLVEKPFTPEQLLAKIEEVLAAPDSAPAKEPNGPTATA